MAVSLMASPAALAQQAAPPKAGEVETDPIRCWWKTDRPAVRIGERFGITLTCGVIETSSVTVGLTTTQLDPGAVQLAPFEVVSGVRHEDVVSPPWRYTQYDYSVRLLGEGFFGQDVTIPPLTVTYTVGTGGAGGAQGRDRQYILPAMPIRILSIVPRTAGDIRDSSTESFGAIEERRFRATTAVVVAGVLFGFAAVFAVIAAVRSFGRVRGRRVVVERQVSPGAVLGACLRTLKEVRRDVAREGWTPAQARRALATLRIAGAVAIERPVSQTIVNGAVEPRDGQIAVRRGMFRPKRALVSAPITAFAMDRQLDAGTTLRGRGRLLAEKLRDALRTFSALGYGRGAEQEVDSLALNGALEAGEDAIKGLRTRQLLPMRLATSVARSYFGL